MFKELELCCKDCDSTCLVKMAFQQYLEPKAIELIELNIRQVKFKKGELMVKQRTKATHIIYLKSGIAKHYFEQDNGKNIILMVKTAPHLIGVANMFNDRINISSIATVEESNACMIDIDIFEKVVKTNSDFLINFFKLVTEMFKSSVFNFINLAHKQAIGRIADVLINLSTEIYYSTKFTLPLTRKELGEFAGSSQENVITTLSKFHKEGIIRIDGKDLEILDFDRLKQISKLG
jgi:CRP/FNR family transcriptional regulator